MATLTLTAAATVAAQLLGVLDSGEALSAQQIADALGLANALWDNWSSDPKKILSLTRVAWNLVGATQAYTIGPAQAINTARPMAVVSAAFTNPSGPGGGIRVRDADSWADLPNRQRQSWIIEDLFYDRGNPTGNVYLSPVPQGNGMSGEIWVWAALAQFVDATTPLTMLPGYIRFFQLSLALEMAPEYDVPVPDSVMRNWQAASSIVESLNASLFATLSPDQQALIAKAAA